MSEKTRGALPLKRRGVILELFFSVTKHLNRTRDHPDVTPLFHEVCTMKPSAREEFGCQTFKDRLKEEMSNVLDPAINETDICRHDKEHLQSVYYMLTAIEGRLRRLKSNVDNNL